MSEGPVVSRTRSSWQMLSFAKAAPGVTLKFLTGDKKVLNRVTAGDTELRESLS